MANLEILINKTKYTTNNYNDYNNLITNQIIKNDYNLISKIIIINKNRYIKNYNNNNDNEYINLPDILPNNLKYLRCESINITYLPKLPNSLKYLICNYNNLTIIPNLPYLLSSINCSYNK